MKMLTALQLFLIMILPAVYTYSNAAGAEGLSTVSSESETVSAAPGKAVSARCTCPAGMELIGGGGECTGFLVTDGWASLAKSAPVPDGSSWYVECANTGTRPGEIQAKAWAICADPAVFDTNKRK
ncbi:MAG: hypothetical protein AB1598_01695 [Thermodesulfobacteriota bacterium]